MRDRNILRGAKEIAEYLEVDPDVIYRLVKSGGALPYYRLGKMICARKSDLHAWIEEQVSRNAIGTAPRRPEKKVAPVSEPQPRINGD